MGGGEGGAETNCARIEILFFCDVRAFEMSAQQEHIVTVLKYQLTPKFECSSIQFQLK